VISGAVRDGEGRPVAGARVYVVDAPGAVPDIAALTDESGRFALGTGPPGRYVVEAAAEGCEPARATVDTSEAASDLDVDLRLTVRPGT
jgi:hypothetical protein